MMIKNLSKKTIVTRNKIFLKSILKKSIGLMFRKDIKDTGFIFVLSKEIFVPLHMFFVWFPIDVLFLDEKMKTVEIKENFRPFTFYSPKKRSKYVVELPKGSVKKSKTEIGDIIGF